MKKTVWMQFLRAACIVILLSGCSTAQPTPTLTPRPPTSTAEPESTATPVPSPTALPGAVVFPVDTLGGEIPWLPLDKATSPSVYYFYFNLSRPPFNSALVRQAFAAAIDRDVLTGIAVKYNRTDPRSATTFTPPETMGRNLYNEVGIPFDPVRAKELLTQAGYTDTSAFPTIKLVVPVSTNEAQGFHVKTTDAMKKMWQEYLDVSVTVEVLDWGTYLGVLATDPPDIFSMSWTADYNDPDGFLNAVFHSGSEYNYAHFENAEYDRLVEQAQNSGNPAERLEYYILAERILCELEAALIPIYHYSVAMP